jgi:opacity protein-like surface antigen
MRYSFAVTSLSLLLALSAVDSAQAQRRRGLVDVTPTGERSGFWMSFGAGAGQESSKLEPETSYTDGLTKPSFSIRAGGTVNPNFRLGVELFGWGDRHYDSGLQDNVTSYLAGLMAIGQFYPSRRAGLFVKGGLGLTRSGEDIAGPGDLHEDGFGYTVGAGYEIKLSRTVFFTPTVDLYQHRSQIRDFNSGTLLPPFHDRLVMLGVALTVQTGR